MQRVRSRFGSRYGTCVAIISSLLTSCSIAMPVCAQQVDVIRGRVIISGTTTPVENAIVVAMTLSGAVSRQSRTDANGRYTITFPNGEGDYWITVVAVGFVPRRFEVKRTADQDILLADARLTRSSSSLDTIAIVGTRDRPARRDSVDDLGGLDRGANAANLSIDQLGNLAAMIASTPGLVFIPGVDGDPAGYSAFGLDPSQNATTINGLNSNATDLPRDGDYSVGVALSPYDVSQGQFSGARTNVRIATGTNYKRSLASFVLDTPHLEWTDQVGRALGQEYSNLNVGGGASGPIRFNEAFYNLSYQAGRVANDLHTLLNTDPLGLQKAGIAADSVTRLLGILDDQRIPATTRRIPDDRNSDQFLVLGAFDIAPRSSVSGQAWKLAFNGGWNKANPLSALPTSLPASLASNTNWNAALQLHHSGYFNFGILTETSVAVSRSRRFMSPYLALPAAMVRINSDYADGTASLANVTFGGATTELSTEGTSMQFLNQSSWFSGNNKHRLKLTTDLRRDTYSSEQSRNALGVFTFASLSDLQAGHASSFARQLSAAHSRSGQFIGSVALGDSYRATDDLQLVVGVRLDANHFSDRPADNAKVYETFGLRNSSVPNRVYVSPRIGFSWTFRTSPEIGAFPGSARNPAIAVRGGIGVFQGAANAQLPLQAITNTGLPSGVQQLTCSGVATPFADWDAYVNDRATIPTTCADGTGATVFSSQLPNVTLFDRRFAAPRSLRSNLQLSKTVADNRVLVTIGAIYSHNMQQPGIVDLNFNPSVRFTMAGEAERPVYVDALSIAPASGRIATRDGRISSDFNHVTLLQSNLSSTATQFQATFGPARASTRATWAFNYTHNRVTDQANGFTSTAASPLDLSPGRSALDWRHQVQLVLGYNLFDVVRLQWFHSFVSGVPFTPLVAGDINGDGVPTNDRAFVYDPATAGDMSVATAMARLIAQSNVATRQCLQRQAGTIASRNSCEAPWTSTASLRIDFNPVRVRMPQRTMLSLSVANPLAGLDLLMHGAAHTHGWGQFRAPDDELLVVRGFDPLQRAYRYDVNPRFGNTSPRNSALRSPATITALIRVDLGPSRERQELARVLDRGRVTPGAPVTAAELRATYGSAGILNPMAIILRSADSLHLDGVQADSIATLNRWFLVRMDSIWTPIVRELAALPKRYDLGHAYGRFIKTREASVDLLIRIAPAITRILSREQRGKLPALTASYLDPRYLRAVRSRTPGIAAPVFPPPAGVPGETGGRGRGGGGG